jgi:hypothetical protein
MSMMVHLLAKNERTVRMASRYFHEKAVKLFLKFISHFFGGGGIGLPSELGMFCPCFDP